MAFVLEPELLLAVGGSDMGAVWSKGEEKWAKMSEKSFVLFAA